MDWSNKQEVLEAIRRDGGSMLFYASEELRGDKEVVLEAVRSFEYAIGFASEELRKDREVVLEAVRYDGEALLNVSNFYGGDREVVLEAVRNNGEALNYASEELRRDKELLEVAIKSLNEEIEEMNEHIKYIEKSEFPERKDPLEKMTNEIISIRDGFNKVLEIINLENKHTQSEIAEGIEPTQTGMDEVTDEMIATQSEKNDPSKDEKPGEEPGDN